MTGQKQRSGGARSGAGRPRKFVKIPKKFYAERSEREPLTETSDLSICLAEIEVDEGDTRPGIVIGDIWYGAEEAQAIADFVKRYQGFYRTGPESPCASQAGDEEGEPVEDDIEE